MKSKVFKAQLIVLIIGVIVFFLCYQKYMNYSYVIYYSYFSFALGVLGFILFIYSISIKKTNFYVLLFSILNLIYMPIVLFLMISKLH